jgi:hypothetical protein
MKQNIIEIADDNEVIFHVDRLEQLSVALAPHAVRVYDGELLQKALGVSIAIANFLSELHRQDDL